MDDERWEALVRRLEPVARSNPTGYRRRVLLLAALGYACIAGLLAVLVALAGLVAVAALHGRALLLKFLIPVGALLAVVVRSLQVELGPPAGIPLERSNAPGLFRMLDDVAAAMPGVTLHSVLVDGDANAGIVQIPRAAGLLGSRNYLVVGLPYLQAMSPDEMLAVVAHEYGHLSGAHGRFGAFVYRVRTTWFQLLAGFEEERSIWTGLVRRLLAWYVPIFDAYSLPAARAHELEADDAAAAVAGAAAAAASLVSGTLAARWLFESYWPEVWGRATEEAAPPVPFAPLAERIGLAKQPEDLEHWYRSVLESEADLTASHPSIAERIAHLGVDPTEALVLATALRGPSASSRYLGEGEADVVAELDRMWQGSVRAEWTDAYAEAQDEKRELERLEAEDSLSADDALRRAQLSEAFRDGGTALARYRELLGTENDAEGRFGIGTLFLQRSDDEGLRWLDEAMDRDPYAILGACGWAEDYLRRRGRDEEAEAYRLRTERQLVVLTESAAERSSLSIDDELEPPSLSDESLEHVRDRVAAFRELRAAYLVRKRTTHLVGTPLHVLVLVPRSRFRTAWKDADEDGNSLVDRVAREITVQGDLTVLWVGKNSPLAARVAQVKGAAVFVRRK